MIRHYLIVWFMLVGGAGACGAAETIFRLDDETIPEVVRREKALGLLRAWGHVSADPTALFVLNDHPDLVRVQHALENVLQHVENGTSGTVSSAADHYLVWAIARAQMLNGLDFSENSIRHFYNINSTRYPCEPTAVVSELVIPDTYTNSLGSTSILNGIKERLRDEPFGQVAYSITDKFGSPDAGLKGARTLKQVGKNRFVLYQQAEKAGGIGGPYAIPGGYLFVEVHSISNDTGDCFQYHRSQVVADYGRQWLRKIYADALTTASAELKPEVMEFTTGTSTSSAAFVVDDHSVTFEDALAMLPHLHGNPNDPRFWQSIQRQALEIELIYHSSIGQKIRQTAEYNRLLRGMVSIAQAQKQIATMLEDKTTTENVEQWFREHRDEYTEISHISYSVYKCDIPEGDTETKYSCAAILEQLGVKGDVENLPDTVVLSQVTREPWNSLPREIQAAMQSLDAGEWSQVHSLDGKPQVIRLISKDVLVPELANMAERVKADYQINLKLRYWERFLGIKFDS